MLFRAHCFTLYASQLWCYYTYESYRRLRVSYNDSYRSIHDIPRYCSVRQYQVEANVDMPTFDALVRKLLFRFMNRCHRSVTSLWMVTPGAKFCGVTLCDELNHAAKGYYFKDTGTTSLL